MTCIGIVKIKISFDKEKINKKIVFSKPIINFHYI